MKKCRCRHRKTLRKVLSELLLQLNLDSQKILAEDYNVNLLLTKVDETLSCAEYKNFKDGLHGKVKRSLYQSFCKEIEFKNCLLRVGDICALGVTYV